MAIGIGSPKRRFLVNGSVESSYTRVDSSTGSPIKTPKNTINTTEFMSVDLSVHFTETKNCN